jgi:hypothetical protein
MDSGGNNRENDKCISFLFFEIHILVTHVLLNTLVRRKTCKFSHSSTVTHAKIAVFLKIVKSRDERIAGTKGN